jgi:predicted RNA-binding protein YlxR (DUF448 family)
MVRAGRGPDGAWYLGRGPGRGAWWCADAGCGSALGPGALARALRAPVSDAQAGSLRAIWLERSGFMER